MSFHARLEGVAAGDLVVAHVCTYVGHDSEEYSPIFGVVQRVNRKSISVIWEHSGRFQRVDPDHLTEMYKPENRYYQELKAASRHWPADS